MSIQLYIFYNPLLFGIEGKKIHRWSNKNNTCKSNEYLIEAATTKLSMREKGVEEVARQRYDLNSIKLQKIQITK